jgi:hypothetical protein
MVVQTGGSACGLTSNYCTYRCVQQVGRNEGGRAGGREGGYRCRKTGIKRYRGPDVYVYVQSLRMSRGEDGCTQIVS